MYVCISRAQITAIPWGRRDLSIGNLPGKVEASNLSGDNLSTGSSQRGVQ